MRKDRLDQQGRNLDLTAYQKIVLKNIIECLRDTNHKTLILLEGLSGIGKSTLLDKFQSNINPHQTVIVDSEVIKYSEKRTILNGWEGHIVTSVVPSELNYFYDSLKSHFSQYDIKQFVLRGMSKDEIRQIIQRLPRQGKNLSQVQAVEYSLGVPHLAKLLLKEGITEEIASRISAGYLLDAYKSLVNIMSIEDFIEKYLVIIPNTEVLRSFKELRNVWDSGKIYSQIYTALKEMEYQRDNGIYEESPLFLCQDSVEMYNKMLKEDYHTQLDIYVPFINTEDYARIQQAYGFLGDISWGQYDDWKATRTKMFSANYRKTIIWTRNPQGICYPQDRRDYSYVTEEKMNEMERVSKYFIKNRKKSNNAELFIHSHDHSGLSLNPISIGWMTESLLQQRGISYLVCNRIYGADYFYDSTKNKLVFIKDH